MKKILVLGATGMLGHKLCQVLNRQFEVVATCRKKPDERFLAVFSGIKLIDNIDALAFSSVESVVRSTSPDYVINCIGVIKQKPEAEDSVHTIHINSLFPHQLARLCTQASARLIHVSTDCVFSGRGGNYDEESLPDSRDLYGRSKLLGEVPAPHLTLRTSIIGKELGTANGLLEWFLSQDGNEVNGYTKAIFSGLTTLELARVISLLIASAEWLSGLWHVGAQPISKYDLLKLIETRFEMTVSMQKDDSFCCDRSLNSQRFQRQVSYAAPSWEDMIRELYEDTQMYYVKENN